MPGTFNSDQHPTEVGFVSIWAGLLADIPPGWVVCDGNNGTPDLRDRFVKGTASSTASPDSRGGANSFTLGTTHLPSHSHSISHNSAGSHDHGIELKYAGSGSLMAWLWNGDADVDTVDDYTSVTGAHAHTVSTGSTGGGSSIDNRPLFYEIAYIMKV